MPNMSSALTGASTGRMTSPCAEKAACNRSDCSLLVGMPVDGPPRWTFTQTSGSSAMLARPSISVLSDMPGPDVAVMRLLAGERRADDGADAGDLVFGLQHRAAVLPDLAAEELHDLGRRA